LQFLFAHRPARIAGRALFAVAMLGLLLSTPAAQPKTTDALGQILLQQDISNTSDQSEIPQITAGAGRLAAVWGERFSEDIGINTEGLNDAKWPRALTMSTGSMTAYQNPTVVVDTSGTTHILFSSGNGLSHRARLPAGNFTGTRHIASSNFPNAMSAALSPTGTIWVVWRDGDGTAIYYKFSRDGGDTWVNGSDGGVVAAEGGNMFAPTIAVDQDARPHIAWYMRSGGPNKGEIMVADWTGTHFETSRVTTDGAGLYDADPVIAVDSLNVQHLAWRKLSGENWVIFYARRAAGGGWQGYTPIATTRGDAKYSPAIGVDPSGAVSVSYSDALSGSSRHILFYSKLPNQGWEGPIALSRGRWDSRSDIVSTNTSAGIISHVVHQHESGTDDGEIIYSRILLKSCGAASAAEAGADQAANGVSAQVFTAKTRIFLPWLTKAPPPRWAC
jgi:hypothetical protein